MSDLLRRRAMMASQSGRKTMQLLAEYTVTEPLRYITIPFTEQMKSCDVLYCALDLTFSASDWLYIGFGGPNQANSWYPGASSLKTSVTVYHSGLTTIDEVVFPARWIMYTESSNGAVPKKTTAPEYISIYMYDASTNITAGTVKIYGEV